MEAYDTYGVQATVAPAKYDGAIKVEGEENESWVDDKANFGSAVKTKAEFDEVAKRPFLATCFVETGSCANWLAKHVPFLNSMSTAHDAASIVINRWWGSEAPWYVHFSSALVLLPTTVAGASFNPANSTDWLALKASKPKTGP